MSRFRTGIFAALLVAGWGFAHAADLTGQVGSGGGGAPTGAAGGDLSGTYPNPGVAKIGGVAPGTGVSTLLGGTSSGTGGPAGTISPIFTAPNIGAASATTINKVTLTQPATGSTLTIADGKTLTDTSVLGAVALKGTINGGFAQAACADLSNAAASCATDATNAGNISAGTLAAARGGTGVSNGTNTITLGASVTTTGAGTPTLAFPSLARTYTFPLTTSTLLSTAGATLNANPANQTATSTTAKMMGLGATCVITPTNSTRITVSFQGTVANNTINDGAQSTVYYGTGTTPVNGAATTGTNTSVLMTYTGGAANQFVPFTSIAVISGLTPGTAYWLDLSASTVSGGTASFNNMSCTANEI